MSPSRRGLLGLGLGLTGSYLLLRHGLPLIFPQGDDLAFEPLSRPEGFRRVIAGATSGAGFDLLIGLDSDAVGGASDRALAAAVQAAPCEALFQGGAGDGTVVPIAAFSDYNCPICRVTTLRLAGAEAVRSGAAKITWHELPILGESSVLAARAALAADRQGAYALFQERLMRDPFRPTPEYLKAVARDLGLDGDAWAADMEGQDVAHRIDRSLALRDLFAFPGTPAIVIGRTVVEGDVSEDLLARLIELERLEGPMVGCG
jgi:protein-disulfide isomerase